MPCGASNQDSEDLALEVGGVLIHPCLIHEEHPTFGTIGTEDGDM